jgi:hypothetical protein
VPAYCVDEVPTRVIALLLAAVRRGVGTRRKMERGEPIWRLAGHSG